MHEGFTNPAFADHESHFDSSHGTFAILKERVNSLPISRARSFVFLLLGKKEKA